MMILILELGNTVVFGSMIEYCKPLSLSFSRYHPQKETSPHFLNLKLHELLCEVLTKRIIWDRETNSCSFIEILKY